MATCPSEIANSPKENCCWLEDDVDGEGAAGGAVRAGGWPGAGGGADCWPSEAKFQTPCAFLMSSTFGRVKVSESTSTDLLSRGSSLTETASSWVWTKGRLELNFGSSEMARFATRKRSGNNPKSMFPSVTLRPNCCSNLLWMVAR